MYAKFRGEVSSLKDMNGGFPQGTLIGGILYICYINPVGFPGEITNCPELMSLLQDEDQSTSTCVLPLANEDPQSSTNCHTQPPVVPTLPTTMNSAKFVDDATVQEVVDLNSTLCTNIDRSGPLPFHESSGKVLPASNSLLQEEIVKIKELSDEREMVLNAKKTKIFIANFSHLHQFRPLLTIPGQQAPIEVTLETKLLGYWLTSDMKPHKHVEYIVSRATKRLYIIRRLKAAGCGDSDLLYVYISLIRSILETACPVFQSQLTEGDKTKIERIQKIAFENSPW